jgi:hypothetical protein
MESQSIDAQGQNQQNQSSEKDSIVKGLSLINESIKAMNLNLSHKFDQLSQQIKLRDQNFFIQMETRDQNLSSKLSEVSEQLKTLDGKINKLKGGKVEKNKSFTRFNLYRDFLERNKRVVPKKMFHERTSHNININTKKIETYIAKNEIKHSKGSENKNISITKKSVNSSSDIQCNYQGNSNSKSNSLKISEQQERYSHTQNKIDKENISSPDEVKESKGNENILTQNISDSKKKNKTLNKSKTRINSNLKKEKEKEKVGANANKSCTKKKGSKKEGDKSGNNYQSFAQESINIEYNGENPHKKK